MKITRVLTLASPLALNWIQPPVRTPWPYSELNYVNSWWLWSNQTPVHQRLLLCWNSLLTATRVWSFVTITEPAGVFFPPPWPNEVFWPCAGSLSSRVWLLSWQWLCWCTYVSLRHHIYGSLFMSCQFSHCVECLFRQLTERSQGHTRITTPQQLTFFHLHISSCIKCDHLPFPSFKEVVIGVRKSHSQCETNHFNWCVNTVKNVCWVTLSFKRITLLSASDLCLLQIIQFFHLTEWTHKVKCSCIIYSQQLSNWNTAGTAHASAKNIFICICFCFCLYQWYCSIS